MTDNLKARVSEILHEALTGRSKNNHYRTEDGFVRWGTVEQDIHSVIDDEWREASRGKLEEVIMEDGKPKQPEGLVCPWCNEAGLEIRLRIDTREYGYYAGCADCRYSNCPDTTGCYPTENEALAGAEEAVAELTGKGAEG